MTAGLGPKLDDPAFRPPPLVPVGDQSQTVLRSARDRSTQRLAHGEVEPSRPAPGTVGRRPPRGARLPDWPCDRPGAVPLNLALGQFDLERISRAGIRPTPAGASTTRSNPRRAAIVLACVEHAAPRGTPRS